MKKMESQATYLFLVELCCFHGQCLDSNVYVFGSCFRTIAVILVSDVFFSVTGFEREKTAREDKREETGGDLPPLTKSA